MADAYARLSKKPSVVHATAGPGVTNMATGLANALLDSVPIVAIGANVPTSSFGRNAVQDGSGRGRATEQRIAMKSVCKQAMLAPSPEEVPYMVREAFRSAVSGRPGPVYIEIPSNMWRVEIEYESVKPHTYKNTHIPLCNPTDSTRIADALYQSERPLIVIGEGADEEGIEEKLYTFLQEVKVPFAVSPIGKNFVDEYNDWCIGVPRDEGEKQKVYEYMKQSDCIIFLGDRMQEWEMKWYDTSLIANAKLAQVDPDYDEIGRVFPVDMSAVGSISSFVSQIEVKMHSQTNKLKQIIDTFNEEFPRQKRYSDGDGINPININNIVEEQSADDATIVCDTGYAKSMAIMKFRTNLKQRFIVADKNGPMGYSVPAALGAALYTGKEVICFVGDGGIQMAIGELASTKQYDLKVIYIIENNSGCSSITTLNEGRYGKHYADHFVNPDYVKIAEGYGMKGYRVETTEEFNSAFTQAQKGDTAVIIDAKVDQSMMVWE